MTLEEAIAEVKRTLTDDVTSESTVPALHVIVAAFDNRELIPKADAEMAVALAYQRAADYVNSCQPGSIYGGQAWLHADANTILALAPADALAEVERMRAKRDDLAKVIDDTESHYGISSNGNMWRFWSDKTRATAALRALVSKEALK